MKKILLVVTLLVFASTASYSNYSMLTCSAQCGITIQVSLNGKLINKNPNEEVRMKSKDGCNSISVVMYDPAQNKNYTVQRDIYIEAGYEVFFNVSYDDCGPKLTISRRYPLLNTYSYSKKLYVRKFIS